MIATRGILLRKVNYGETSIICTIFTEKMGNQSYIIKGVRSSKYKNKRANILFTGALLELECYNNPLKQLQYINTFQLANTAFISQSSVVKNCIIIFCVEILQVLIQDNQAHTELFQLYEELLEAMNISSDNDCANYALYFLIKASGLMGYTVSPIMNFNAHYFDIINGVFTLHPDPYGKMLSSEDAEILNTILQIPHFQGLESIKIPNKTKHTLLTTFLHFLQYHIPNFREVKSLSVLTTILHT